MTDSRDMKPRFEASEVSARPAPSVEDRQTEGKASGTQKRSLPRSGGPMRYSTVADADTWKGKLHIAIGYIALFCSVAFMGVILGLVCWAWINETAPLILKLFALFAPSFFIIYFIVYILWDLSKYQLCQEGIIIRTLLTTKTIKWSEIQHIEIYKFVRYEWTSAEYLTIFLNGGDRLRSLQMSNAFFKRKNVILVLLTEERLAEFEDYWPHKILKGAQTDFWRNE